MPQAQGKRFPVLLPSPRNNKLIDCSPRSHGISVLLLNLPYNFYEKKEVLLLQILVNDILITWSFLNIPKMLDTVHYYVWETVWLSHDSKNQKRKMRSVRNNFNILYGWLSNNKQCYTLADLEEGGGWRGWHPPLSNFKDKRE